MATTWLRFDETETDNNVTKGKTESRLLQAASIITAIENIQIKL